MNRDRLEFIKNILIKAERIGVEDDDHEEMRYIQISDTLAQEMIDKINSILLEMKKI